MNPRRRPMQDLDMRNSHLRADPRRWACHRHGRSGWRRVCRGDLLPLSARRDDGQRSARSAPAARASAATIAENDLGSVPFAYAVIPTCDPYFALLPGARASRTSSPRPAAIPSSPRLPPTPTPTTTAGWGRSATCARSTIPAIRCPTAARTTTVQRIWSMSAADAGQQPCIPATAHALRQRLAGRRTGHPGERREPVRGQRRRHPHPHPHRLGAARPSVPFAMRVGSWGVGLVPASYGLGVSIGQDQSGQR